MLKLHNFLTVPDLTPMNNFNPWYIQSKRRKWVLVSWFNQSPFNDYHRMEEVCSTVLSEVLLNSQLI